MNNERMDYLLSYMDGLTKLANSEVSYRCNNEIAECIGWIRDEFQAYDLPIGALAGLLKKADDTND